MAAEKLYYENVMEREFRGYSDPVPKRKERL